MVYTPLVKEHLEYFLDADHPKNQLVGLLYLRLMAFVDGFFPFEATCGERAWQRKSCWEDTLVPHQKYLFLKVVSPSRLFA